MNKSDLIDKIEDMGLRDVEQSGPLYRRLASILQKMIKQGALVPYTSLPPERDLAEGLRIGRVTVRNAYKELLAQGYVVSRHGSGTYIADQPSRISQSLWRLTSFSENMLAHGKNARTEILSQNIAIADNDERLKLGLAENSQVLRLARLRFADNEPVAIENAVIPLEYMGEHIGAYIGQAPDYDQSLYALLAKRGFRPVTALQRLTAVVLDAEQASLLNLKKGAPALFIERVARLKDQRAVEYTRSLYRSDAFDFVAELKIGEHDV